MGRRQYLNMLYGSIFGVHPHAASGMTGVSVNLFDNSAVMYKPTIGNTSGNFPASTTDFNHVFDVSSSSIWNPSKRYAILKSRIVTSGANSLRHKLPHENVETDPRYHDISSYGTTFPKMVPYQMILPINSSGHCNLWWSAASQGVNTASGSTYISVVGFL